MTTSIDANAPERDWLKTYYYLRFAVSALWVALALTIARTIPQLAAVMLIAYPAWDALATIWTPAGAAAWLGTRARC
ncbi:hypothetical protein [Sphingomonas endolithica]|uniref:hypothetical protein n=1 Tax=Sphingomonas endolithica TaxID=2972485 RepID=UPI0021AEA708|nr:hypothetical protein [Sphingomonas sp. ZFBP2030]